jgi:hypothetical protein
MRPHPLNRQEDIRKLFNEVRLLLRCQHEIPVTVGLGSQCCENPSANAKIRGAHVRTFLRPLETQRDPSEICRGDSSLRFSSHFLMRGIVTVSQLDTRATDGKARHLSWEA